VAWLLAGELLPVQIRSGQLLLAESVVGSTGRRQASLGCQQSCFVLTKPALSSFLALSVASKCGGCPGFQCLNQPGMRYPRKRTIENNALAARSHTHASCTYRVAS
jgi:hypothetical protein